MSATDPARIQLLVTGIREALSGVDVRSDVHRDAADAGPGDRSRPRIRRAVDVTAPPAPGST